MIESLHDPYDELEWAKRDMEALNDNAAKLDIKDWMKEWREIRSRIQRATFRIEEQARNLV